MPLHNSLEQISLKKVQRKANLTISDSTESTRSLFCTANFYCTAVDLRRVFYTPEKDVSHTRHVKVAIEKSLSSTQIAYRQQDNCTNTFIIYSTIPMSALKHTYQLRDMAITLHGRTTISPGQRQPWTAISLLLGLISMA